MLIVYDRICSSGNHLCDVPGSPVCSFCNLTNISICLQCAQGYYLPASAACEACQTNCQVCTSAGCIVFKQSANHFGVVIGGMTYAAVCDPWCLQCSIQNPGQCITCAPGSTSVGGVCMPCPPLCKSCSPNNTTQCLSCFDNIFFNETDGTCNATQCLIPNCLVCMIFTDFCLVCQYGFFVALECSATCPLNCLSCLNSSYCTLCQQGYSANSRGVCLPCLSNCRFCASSANAICLNCGQAFYLSSSSICIACSSYCLSCNSLRCTSCMVGYVFNMQFLCVPVCQVPCATCSSSNPSQCTSCLAGYQLNGPSSICAPVTTCSDGCSLCPWGYTLSQNQCLQCTAPNCARCLPTNTSSCLSCRPGFYLSTNSTCIACPSGCSICINQYNCRECTPGYTAAIQPISTEALICVQCISPCATCMANANTCTSCVSGYRFQGWKCISQFNFGFVVVLNITLTGFYGNYYGFLNDIAKGVSAANKNVITMNSISNNLPQIMESTSTQLEAVSQPVNEVTVQGSVSTTSQSHSNQATTEYYQLNAILQPGTSIAGMTITSSSVTVNGGEIIQPFNKNLAIILGVCIPGGLIIIGLVVYFVYRGKKQKQSEGKSLQGRSSKGVKEDFQLSTP